LTEREKKPLTSRFFVGSNSSMSMSPIAVKYLRHTASIPQHSPPSPPFYGPFSGTTWVSQCQKIASSGLYGAREENKRQTNQQSG